MDLSRWFFNFSKITEFLFLMRYFWSTVYFSLHSEIYFWIIHQTFNSIVNRRLPLDRNSNKPRSKFFSFQCNRHQTVTFREKAQRARDSKLVSSSISCCSTTAVFETDTLLTPGKGLVLKNWTLGFNISLCI